MGLCCSTSDQGAQISAADHGKHRKQEAGNDKKMLLGYLDEENEGQQDNDDTSTAAGEPVLKKKVSVYKSVKGDQVDEAMEILINRFNVNLPVIRIGDGKYLIGTEQKMVVLRNSTCMVRVGGGFERMEDYIARNQESEIEKIKKIMNDQNKSYD